MHRQLKHTEGSVVHTYLKKPRKLSDCIGRTLEPIHTSLSRCLRGCQHLHNRIMCFQKKLQSLSFFSNAINEVIKKLNFYQGDALACYNRTLFNHLNEPIPEVNSISKSVRSG